MPTPRVLVFGGTGLIGAAICRLLAPQAKLVLTYRSNKERADELRGMAPDTRALCCDFKNGDEIREVVSEAACLLGGLDAVVIATGAPQDGVFRNWDEVRPDDLQEMVDLHVKGPFLACQAAVNWLKENPSGGNIVVVGSLVGSKPIPAPVPFAAAKAAQKGVVESLSRELGDYNVKVNLLAPGLVAGEGGEGKSSFLSKMPPHLKQKYLKHCGLARFARPEEIAEIAAWFACENTYITGQTILLDGGV